MAEIPLTQARVAIVDDADFERLSRFRWRLHESNRGRLYAIRSISRRDGGAIEHARLMHVEIMGFVGIDHVNGDGLDNRRQNLRRANQAQNSANARPRTTHAGRPLSSPYKGVSFHRRSGKWRASIGVDFRHIHLGLFEDEIAAARAYNAAARLHYGDFARINTLEVSA